MTPNRTLAIVFLSIALLLGAVAFGFALATASDAHRWTTLAEAWLAPQTTVQPSPIILVRKVRTLARLETTSMELEQTIRGQRGDEKTWGWVGERLDFRARGEVIAGIDLEALGDEAIQVDEDGLWVTLPPAEVWSVNLDEEHSFVAARERGWFAMPDKDLETEVRRHAESELRKVALEKGILEKADAQAEVAIRALLETAGASNVRFR